jgi:hypothetical protein
MPMLSEMGTKATRKVAIPIGTSVAINVALRPMRSRGDGAIKKGAITKEAIPLQRCRSLLASTARRS